jgi:hypothetical protein
MHLHAIVLLHGLIQGLAPHGLGGMGRFLRPKGLQDTATFAIIIVGPFAIWLVKRQVDRWEERKQREDVRRCAVDVAVTLAKSIQLCENVRQALQTAGRVPEDTVAAAIESLDLSRQTLRLYLRRHIPLHELIPLATAAEQGLGEGCQAMLTLHGARPGGVERDAIYARQLQAVRAELQAVVDRLRRLEPDLGRAIAKVDAGWAPGD